MMNTRLSYCMITSCVLLALGMFAFPCAAFSPSRSSIRQKQLSTLGLFGGLFRSKDNTTPPVILDIPATNVKVGALRFLLQIYLVGIQNEPSPKSWLTQQADNGDLQVFFKDGTAMVSIDFQEYVVKISRIGDRPSLQYMLQESVLLHGILDELNNVALEADGVEQEKLLLQLSDHGAIEKARSNLPARKA